MALTLDGTTGEVSYGAITELEQPPEFTVMGWVTPAALGVADRLVTYGSPAVNGFLIRAGSATATTLEVIINNVGSTWATFWANGVPVHVAVVYNQANGTNATKLRVFQNGVFVAATAIGAIPNILASTVDNFRWHSDVAGAEFSSTDAHVKVWNRALPDEEIFREAYAYRPQNETNLLLWAPFDDGLIAGDFSGNERAATVTGATAGSGHDVVWYPDATKDPSRNRRRIMRETLGQRRYTRHSKFDSLTSKVY